MKKPDPASIAAQFALPGALLSLAPHGSGHIHDTYAVVTTQGRCILQRINTAVFTDPEGVMANIAAVTAHLRHAYESRGIDPTNRVLRILPTREGKPLYWALDGSAWRMYPFIEGGITRDAAESPEDCRACGKAFGEFQALLSDFPAESLKETIPLFHHTPSRFQQLIDAIAADPLGRLATVKEEVSYCLSQAEFCFLLENAHARGELPLRVTHNDTKINNCMLDAAAGEPLCVLDLDTVMPGYSVNDFGDAIRSGAGSAAEDARDASAMELDLTRYAAYLEGFLAGCGDSLTPSEIRLLPVGARMMTLECGLRFLADYLLGDRYFKTDYPEHNLVRCRTQLALVQDMDRKWEALERLSLAYL